MTREADATGREVQPWLRGELAALCSAREGERRAAVDRWRSCTDPRALTLVLDSLLEIVKRGGPQAPFAAESLKALGESVLSRVVHHFVRSHTPKVRVRLLN